MSITARIVILFMAVVIGYAGMSHFAKEQPIDISHIIPLFEGEVILIEPENFLVQIDERDFECMRTNMYFEARNQKTDESFIAVGYTVLNRVASKRYPNSVCDVVYQARRDSNDNPIRNKCQFSWACDGKPDVPNLKNVLEQRAWERAGELAAAVLRNEVDNPVGNATMYHATYVSPYWKTAYTKVATIETHIFYSQKV